MRAKITNNDVHNGKDFSGSKEVVGSLTVIGLKKGEMFDLMSVKWYMARSSSASVVYCSLNIYAKDVHIFGSGSAGGWGYHKESAAFQEALDSAGIELYGSPYFHKDLPERHKDRCFVHGCGDAAVERACEAIAKALRFNKCKIVRG